MLPKDWFGVAARVLGLWTFIEGIRGFIMAYGYEKGWFGQGNMSEYYLLNSTAEIMAGVFLLRGTNVLVRICYPDEEPQSGEPVGEGAESDELKQNEALSQRPTS